MATKKKDTAPDEEPTTEELRALVEKLKASKPEQAESNGTAEEQPVDGIFIPVGYDPEGNVHTDVILNGNVKVTEVQTIMEVALRGFRSRIGLSGQAGG